MSDVKAKRKSGIPTGNSGEYFVMGELLRREYDAQLADRNTAGYDLLVGRAKDPTLTKVQIKTVRTAPWYVKQAAFKDPAMLEQITIYVLLGKLGTVVPVRYFIARNFDLAGQEQISPNWKDNAFMPYRTLVPYEDRWDMLTDDIESRLTGGTGVKPDGTLRVYDAGLSTMRD